MKGREEDDEHKTKTIKNQTCIQSSPLIGPAAPDRHGQVQGVSEKTPHFGFTDYSAF